MLEVTTNFVPVRFSTARLLQKPIRLTIKPIKKQKTKKKLFFTMAPVVKKTTVSAFCCINNDLSSSSSSSSSSISREPMAAVAASILANASAAALVSASTSANAAQDWIVASSVDRRDDKPTPASSKDSKRVCMKKILVTGATGSLGGKLCHALFQQGHPVRVLVRRTSDLSSLPPPTDAAAIEIVYGDVTDYQSLLAACSGCHVIFHVAAVVEPWLPDPSKFFSVNVGGLRNVLQAVRETTIEKLIYTSSFFALGPTDGGNVADENQVHHEKYFCTEYEKSKAIADKIAIQAASEGVPIVPVYPGVIYGTGKVTSGNIVAKMIVERFNWRLPGYIGSGNDKFSFSHVDDVVEGHIAAMNKGKPGERYLLSGENASFRHVFDLAAIITETKKPMLNIPFWAIDAYGWASVLISRITGKIPLISPPAVKVLKHQWAYSCEKAKVELDYNPRSLKDGLAEMLPWLKNLGLIKF